MEKDNVEMFHMDLDNALAELCRKWNLEKIKSHITYSSSDLSITIKLNEKNFDGSMKYDVSKESKLYSALHNYIAEDVFDLFTKTRLLGCSFVANGTEYQIIDWNTRARSYPIIYKRLIDNAQYKCSADWIAPYITKKLRCIKAMEATRKTAEEAAREIAE